MSYFIILITAAVMISAAVVGCWKPGARYGISKYGREEDIER